MGICARFLAVFGAATLMVGVMAAGSASAAPTASPVTCSGSLANPGVLAGVVPSVVVSGVCLVDAGPAVVTGNVTIEPKATLIAAFALNNSSLVVNGNVTVGTGATAILGCEASAFSCADDPNQMSPTLNSADHVSGNLTATGALGVIVHNSSIGDSLRQTGGGGGKTCVPRGIFGTLLMSPVFSDYEDNVVGGSVSITDMKSCYLAVIRDKVGGNVNISNNILKDPDAIEIETNVIGGNLACAGNSMAWDSSESPIGFYPRIPNPNTVGGIRSGQCLLSSPTVMGGPSGPGPF